LQYFLNRLCQDGGFQKLTFQAASSLSSFQLPIKTHAIKNFKVPHFILKMNCTLGLSGHCLPGSSPAQARITAPNQTPGRDA
jgi:hypothetical protein